MNRSLSELADAIYQTVKGTQFVPQLTEIEWFKVAQACRDAAPSVRPEAGFWTWIACSERLPENSNTVLAYESGHGKCIAYYLEVTQSWIVAGVGDRLYEVTHWMPLPGSPEPSPQQESPKPRGWICRAPKDCLYPACPCCNTPATKESSL